MVTPAPITVFKGRDNSNSLYITLNGSRYDISSSTKVEIVCEEFTISSADDPDWFDYTTNGSSGILTIKLGASSDLVIDTIYDNCNVLIYDSTNTNGLEVGELRIDVE